MAEGGEESTGQDRTEEASPERREEFRERGQIAVSRELSSVITFMGLVIFLGSYLPKFRTGMLRMLEGNFASIGTTRIDASSLRDYGWRTWTEFLSLILPIGAAAAVGVLVGTFVQTRANFAWQKTAPDFSRLNPIAGIQRMFSMQAVVEVAKGIAKLGVIAGVSYAILFGERHSVPGLLYLSLQESWLYWGHITQTLFWGVGGLLLFVAAGDFLYSFMSLERKLKMTKQEVKEEAKKREVDPHLKGRQRRAQRDIANRRTIASTRKATVVITNPTHFAVALRYTVGMRAPICVAKGSDLVALKMREVAAVEGIPVVEDPPLARALFAAINVGHEIPENMYKAVSQIIRYVFKLRGVKVPKRETPELQPL